jgi:putative ABC transport system permease protein
VLLVAAPADIPRLADVAIDARVLFVVLSIAVAVGFVFGLIPLWQARRTDLQTVLKAEQGRGATGGRDSATARSILMAGEIALAVVLVIGAGLLIKSFWQLQQVNPWIRRRTGREGRVSAAGIALPDGLPAISELQGDSAVQCVAPRARVRAAGCGVGWPLPAIIRSTRGSPTRLLSSGREAEARDWPEISVRRATPGVLSYAAAPAGSRPADPGLRYHAGGAGRAHQRSGGRAVFHQAGSHRPADGYLWNAQNDSSGSWPTRRFTG